MHTYIAELRSGLLANLEILPEIQMKTPTMILHENNYIEILNGYSKNHWKPLLELIPAIEKIEKFGDGSKVMQRLEQGILDTNAYEEHPIVQQFRDVVHAIPIIIDFNWPDWEEGHKMISDECFDYDSVDIPTQCKIITAIVRNDRYCSGRLVEAFESGMMLKVLKSIRKHVSGVNVF